jgi:septal ring factor EnvC (AmiA/AmiB activator)
MLAANGTPLALAGELIAIIIGVVAISAIIYVYFKASSGRQLVTLQDAAIAALQATVTEQARQLVELKSREQALREDLSALREHITQIAKVDELRQDLKVSRDLFINEIYLLPDRIASRLSER